MIVDLARCKSGEDGKFDKEDKIEEIKSKKSS